MSLYHDSTNSLYCELSFYEYSRDFLYSLLSYESDSEDMVVLTDYNSKRIHRESMWELQDHL